MCLLWQVRVLALCCAADLMKDSAAHEETVHSQSFLSVVMAALQVSGPQLSCVPHTAMVQAGRNLAMQVC